MSDPSHGPPGHWLSLYYRNNRLLMATIFIILASGFSAFQSLPRMEDPRPAIRLGVIATSWPGAGADKMESLVADKVERSLDTVEEIDEIISRARTGESVIKIILKDRVRREDTDEIWSRIRDKLKDVTPALPDGASTPTLNIDDVEVFTTMVAVVWPDELKTPVNQNILGRLADELEHRLRLVKGTEHTRTFARQAEEILVELSSESLIQLGLTTHQIADKIKSLDAKVAAGQLVSEDSRISLEVSGEIQQLNRLRELPLMRTADDKILKLGQVATIHKSTSDPPYQLSYISGEPAVIVAARMQLDDRVDLWTDRIEAAIASFESELSHGIKLKIVFQQDHYTSKRLAKLTRNFLLAVLAVMVVVFVMMGCRSALIIGISLPLSALLVLTGMDYMNQPIHQMSISGLIISLGLLIDNAIVMVDEVRRRIRRAISNYSHTNQASSDSHASIALVARCIAGAVRHLAIPLLGSTLTTIFCFMPIALMPGPSGEFIQGMAFSVILALIGSFFLSMTVIPAIAGILDTPKSPLAPPESDAPRGFAGTCLRYISRFLDQGLTINWLDRPYRFFLRGIMRYPIAGIVIGMALPCAGFICALELKEQFFPPADRDQFQIQFHLPRHSSITATSELALQARMLVMRNTSVSDVHLFIGDNAPLFYYNLPAIQDKSPYYAQALVQLESSASASQLIHEIQDALNQAMPQVQSIVLQLEQGPPFDAPVELVLEGPDLDVLSEYGETARRIFSTLPDVEHSRATLAGGNPKIVFHVNEHMAQNIGINNLEIARQLHGTLDGSQGGSMIELSEELNVRIRINHDTRGNLNEIAQLPINLPLNQPDIQSHLPYASLGHFSIEPQLTAIERRDGVRTNTIMGFIRAGVLPSTVRTHFENALDSAGFKLPSGYTMTWRGESGERDDAIGNLMSYVMILAVLIVATLILSLKSYTLSIIIGIVAAASLGLGMGCLWIFDYPFGFVGIVACMGLMGVAINDAIVVMIALRESESARLKNVDAGVQIVTGATRHVLSTTLTTIAGFMPLLLSEGEFWPPVAVVIGGGVLGATLLALTLVPSAFFLFYARRDQSR